MKNARADIIDLEIRLSSEKYPRILREIPDPPEVLFIKIKRGVVLEFENSLAMVGTRKATRSGYDLAFKTAADLGARGFTIISGLALGIDTAAHKGAVSTGTRTIAIMAGGLDGIYPPQNKKLADEILDSGGYLISEQPPGTPPYKHNFLQRNRIISGLSMATIVVEAPKISGAINTARLAAEQGRDVFVFPGSADQLNYAGSNALIRDGARLVSGTGDVLEDLGIAVEETKAGNAQKTEFKSDAEEDIYEVISAAGGSLPVDKIIEATKLQPQMVSTALVTLLVRKLVREERGKYFI